MESLAANIHSLYAYYRFDRRAEKGREKERGSEREIEPFAKVTRPYCYRDTAIDIACQLAVTSATENSA